MEQQLASLEQALLDLRAQAEQEHNNVMTRFQALKGEYLVRVGRATGVRFEEGTPGGTQARRTWTKDISASKAIQGL
eukprot:6279299-Alexandrium_andersonii.AAC.1